jgi:hypothetical protein
MGRRWRFFAVLICVSVIVFLLAGLGQLIADEALENLNAEYISAETKQAVIVGSLALTLIVTLLTAVFTRAYQGRTRSLWITALVFSLLCTGGTGAIWYTVIRTSPFEQLHHQNILLHESEVEEVTAQQRQLAADRDEPAPIFIPTGIFVQSIEFENSYDVHITGYAWQRYRKDIPESVQRGIILVEADDIEMTEVYRVQQNDEEVIGWHFDTNVRQAFFYEAYPFDRQEVWLRLWTADFQNNVLLVPDFAAYDVDNWDPFLMLGMEQDFVSEHLYPESSYFSYSYNTYNTNFGIKDYVGEQQALELYFNIEVKRNYVDAFIGHIIPLVIVILMAFGVQMILTHNREHMELYGVSVIDMMVYCASLFFIAILSHITLRTELSAHSVMYMEYFYFVIYIILLLVTLNGVLFLVTDHFSFIEFKDNLLPKVLFFPITLGLIYLLTFYQFY